MKMKMMMMMMIEGSHTLLWRRERWRIRWRNGEKIHGDGSQREREREIKLPLKQKSCTEKDTGRDGGGNGED